jgi:hypothetical protein
MAGDLAERGCGDAALGEERDRGIEETPPLSARSFGRTAGRPKASLSRRHGGEIIIDRLIK